MATTYFYCSGYTVQSTEVTADFGNCNDYRTYQDDYCYYETWSRTIRFSIPAPIVAPLTIRYRYYQEYYINGTLNWEGWVDGGYTIPAGQTFVEFVQDCKENRYCNMDGGVIPVQGGVIPIIPVE